jgi:hypothetical protein
VEPDRQIFVTDHNGPTVEYGSVSVGGTAIIGPPDELQTYAGGQPDPGFHTHQSIGVTTQHSGAAPAYMLPPQEHDYLALGLELAVGGLCTAAAFKARFTVVKILRYQ